MDLTFTAILAAGLLAFAALCGWRGARPSDPARGPRMMPWRPLMALSAAAALFLLVHLLNLLGVDTGNNGPR